jgi:hypothetical protein
MHVEPVDRVTDGLMFLMKQKHVTSNHKKARSNVPPIFFKLTHMK